MMTKWKKQGMALAICAVLLVAFSGIMNAEDDNTKADGTSNVLSLLVSTEEVKAHGDVITSFPAQGSSPRGITYDGTYL